MNGACVATRQQEGVLLFARTLIWSSTTKSWLLMSDAGGLPPDLDRIEARLAASSAPWCLHNDDVWRGHNAQALAAYDESFGETDWPYSDDETPTVFHGDTGYPGDAEFIAHAPADVAALVARVRALEAEMQQLREHIEEQQQRCVC